MTSHEPTLLPVRSLTLVKNPGQRTFWLVARLGTTLSIRKGAQMRNLREQRLSFPDVARASAALDVRVAAQLAKGMVDDLAFSDLEGQLLAYEPVLAEMEPEILRLAADALLARPEWSSTLGAQALVRALASGPTRIANHLDLIAPLLVRLERTAPGEQWVTSRVLRHLSDETLVPYYAGPDGAIFARLVREGRELLPPQR